MTDIETVRDLCCTPCAAYSLSWKAWTNQKRTRVSGWASVPSRQRKNWFHEQPTAIVCPLMVTVLLRAPRIRTFAVCKKRPAVTYRCPVTERHTFLIAGGGVNRIPPSKNLIAQVICVGSKSSSTLMTEQACCSVCSCRSTWSTCRCSSSRRSCFGFALFLGVGVWLHTAVPLAGFRGVVDGLCGIGRL